MVRFIFGCAFFMALSVMAVPIYYGVAKNKESLETVAAANTTDTTISFEEIYDVAGESQGIDPAALNAIMPAAGASDSFPSSFQAKEDPALAGTPEVNSIETLTEE